jgi:hypothetical protein
MTLVDYRISRAVRLHRAQEARRHYGRHSSLHRYRQHELADVRVGHARAGRLYRHWLETRLDV